MSVLSIALRLQLNICRLIAVKDDFALIVSMEIHLPLNFQCDH